MFDYKKWSKKVYQYTEQIGHNQVKNQAMPEYEKEIEKLWNSLMVNKDDIYVQILNKLLSATRDSMNGKLSQKELQNIVDEIREEALKIDGGNFQ